MRTVFPEVMMLRHVGWELAVTLCQKHGSKCQAGNVFEDVGMLNSVHG